MSLKWPRVLMKDFVNLLCVESNNEEDERMREEVMLGHVDKVKKARKTVQLNDLAPVTNSEMSNCILVQGAPGSGKTMFSWELCRRWGQGELLHHYPLVVMLPLRDPDIQNPSSLEDLFPHDHKLFQKEVVEAVEQEAGKRVLFLLDGFDELPAVERQESSFWMRLITGRLLPLATVMVTSRPWSINPLLAPEYISRISQHVEIVGFTSDNINEYINKAFPSATEKNKFCDYLSTCPHIRSIMYIPLNCAIVVEVYRSSGSQHSYPKTMTKLYTALVKELLLRYIKSYPSGCPLGVLEWRNGIFRRQRRLSLFEDIPFNVYQQLCMISSIAYDGLSNNQQLIFSDLPANFETLGLLQKVFQLHSTGEKAVSYNFLHLTVQEFLAAFHILVQKPNKRQKLFRLLTIRKEDKRSGDSGDSLARNATDDKRIQSSDYFVRLFVAGLSGCRDCSVPVPLRIRKEQLSSLHLLFESQNKSLITSELGDRASVREVQTHSPSPHDVYVLGYCISQSSCQWKLTLEHIGDEHTEMMKRAINAWGPGEGAIIRIWLVSSCLTTIGIGHLLSLPLHTLSSLSELFLHHDELDIQPCDMSEHRLCSLKPHLKVLSLHGYGIGCEGVQLLSQFLDTNTTLRGMNLSYAGIKGEGVCSLAKALSENNCLEELNLRGNQIGHEGAELLSQSLYTHTTLRRLYLSHSSIKEKEFCSFVKALSTNNSLEVLNFSVNEIGCENAELLPQSLSANTKLRVLYLSGNDIKDSGGCALAKALQVNNGLERLFLSDNPLGEESIRQLIGGLQDNCTLKLIYFPRLWKGFAHNCSGFNEIRFDAVFF